MVGLFNGLIMKRLKHPLHGFHHAYNPTEEAYMRLNGWVDDVDSEDATNETIKPAKRAYKHKVKNDDINLHGT